MVPLILDLRGKKVIIFGGGAVGARKARFFYGEAMIKVISRTFSREIEGMDLERISIDLSLVDDERLRSLVRGASLVVAATPAREINDRIGRICREQGILFNNADGEPGDAILPAVSGGRNYLVAVTTFGRSPAFARYLRMILDERSHEFDMMISLQERLRSWLKAQEPDGFRRSQILRAVISDPDVWNDLREGEGKAMDRVKERYLDEYV
ncbi:MAG: bifunctional precorrin-2 dehydrogenase/sirohydrochlorin ferrochelatase [Methanomicrobiales archaeon]|nr:bifunctional precorrin-2 dehydrogenase/sirohydrochlorin ferrochelatase [Methanomicrobiales archaeon]